MIRPISSKIPLYTAKNPPIETIKGIARKYLENLLLVSNNTPNVKIAVGQGTNPNGKNCG